MDDRTVCARWLSEHAATEEILWTGRATSGLCALLITLAKGITRVVVPNNVCLTVVAAIRGAGLKPEFLDIDSSSQSLSPAGLANLSPGETRVVVYPHMYGLVHPHVFDVARICHERNWFMVEDCAQSLGGRSGGQFCGRTGDAALFSFGRGKIVDCSWGGALALRDQGLLERVRAVYGGLPLRHPRHAEHEIRYGRLFKETYSQWQAGRRSGNGAPVFLRLLDLFHHLFVHRTEDLPFRGIRKGLDHLVDNLACRTQAAQLFRQFCLQEGIAFVEHPEGSTYWRFNMLPRPQVRDALLAQLHEQGCHASSWFPSADRLVGPVASPRRFPVSDAMDEAILNLWVFGVDATYADKVMGLIQRHPGVVRGAGGIRS